MYTYVVQSGDTLQSIAEQFQTSPGVLMRSNGLRSGTICAGQTLQIPGRAFGPMQPGIGMPVLPQLPGLPGLKTPVAPGTPPFTGSPYTGSFYPYFPQTGMYPSASFPPYPSMGQSPQPFYPQPFPPYGGTPGQPPFVGGFPGLTRSEAEERVYWLEERISKLERLVKPSGTAN